MRTPLPHQQAAIDRLVAQGGRGLLCDEMGLGKSSVALWVMERLGCCRFTIVCPLSVTHKWVTEVTQTLDLDSIIVNRKAKHWHEISIHVIHYEGLLSLPEWKQLSSTGLIIDESHYAKSRTAQRSRAVHELARRCKHVLCLTGTLVRNDVRDVWHQADLAVPGHLGTYPMFEARYCDFRSFKLPSMRRPVKQFRSARNESELASKLSEIMVRRKKVDVVDLPPKQRVVVPLDMDKETARIYREMKTQAMATIADTAESVHLKAIGQPDRSIIARTALEQAVRLEQIACGVIGGADEPIAISESAKIQWTLETIEDLRSQGRSVVVFCKFNATLERIGEEIASLAQVYGEVSAADRSERIAAFRKGDVSVLLCQLKLAEGFDLTPCTDAIFLGIDWTPAMMDQAEDRLHRIGTTGQVTCYYPLMRKTIDERLYRVVMEKREDARRVLGDVQVMREEVMAS